MMIRRVDHLECAVSLRVEKNAVPIPSPDLNAPHLIPIHHWHCHGNDIVASFEAALDHVSVKRIAILPMPCVNHQQLSATIL